MTLSPEQIYALAEPWLWSSFVVFLRVGAAMMFLPAFGESAVPLRIKLAVAIMFSLVLLPIVESDLNLPVMSQMALLGYIGTEVLAGLVLGFSMRATLWALQIAGTIMAQSVSLSQMIGGDPVEPQPAVTRLLTMAALALAAVSDLPVWVTHALVRSYDAIPAGPLPLAGGISLLAINRVSLLFSTAFAFSAPFVIAAFLYNLALGVINRAMPQLMVIFIGAPAITAGGLLLLMVGAPLVLDAWLTLSLQNAEAPFRLQP
jgi:flagellar biosynthetic protein FliR